ncbi:MAG: ABC transporter ATP-binding protein [Candidatus Bathyarchaeota archaeon]|jgi:tungstate transport system ATP-binding protein
MKPIIELKDITKQYEKITALDKVDLNVIRGEVLSLIGPNGAGKTTLLRIIAGIEKPTSGKMLFNGIEAKHKNIDKVRLSATMVFQKTTLFNTNVYNNVAYGLRIRGIPKQEMKRKVKESCKVVKLEGYEKRPAKKLSGGEQQRVALARALVLDTELLLLDEPTVNVDPKNASIIEEALTWLNKQKRTTIVVATHNMFQAQSLAKRAALLLNGKMREVGTIQEIFKTPSRYLTSFARLENSFSGISETTIEGTSLIDIGEDIQIEVAFQRTGEVTVYVRPEDIIISRKPVVSSARNVFKGKITEMVDLGPVLRLKVDAGKEFVVQVTKRSFNEMKLNMGSMVFLVFKASAVQSA